MFLCFLNTVEFLTHYYIYLNLYNSAYFVTSVCQLLLWEWFCSSILLTEYKRKSRKSTILFKSVNKERKTLRQITALSLRIFTINTVILFLVAILRLHSYQICMKQTRVIGNATLSIWMRRARITRASLILCVFYVEQVVGKKYFMRRAIVFRFLLKRFVYIGDLKIRFFVW